MYRIPGAYSRKTTTSARTVSQVQPIRGQAEDRERIAAGLNDVVVRRLLAAGQELQAALGLMGDHPANGKIRHAVDELDQAIRDIPDTVFDRRAGEQPPLGTSTSTT
jgi:signal transduction histidine kinase